MEMERIEISPEIYQAAADIAAAAPMILQEELLEELGWPLWMDGLYSLIASQEKRNWEAEFSQAFYEMELAQS